MYASRLENLNISTLGDFLLHLPSRYEDYSLISKIAKVQAGETVTIQGQVLEVKTNYMRGGRIKTMQKATVIDDTGSMELTWFNQPFLTKTILPKSTISASGRVQWFGKKLSIANPEYEIFYDENSKAIHTARLVPIYPETKGISSKWLRRQIHNLLQQNSQELLEYLPDEILQKNHFLNLVDAIKEIHYPKTLETAEEAHKRLAFDELFLLQLASQKRRYEWEKEKQTKPYEISKYQKQIKKCISLLPFTLTNAQTKALDEILHDLTRNKPMNRLLQGDVGSGKTVVAAIAMYVAHLNGFQSVLMAPTEILANQHFKTISQLLSPLKVKIGLSTRSSKYYVASIKNTDILVGTHAVLSEKIKFKNLGLVIIDEQQRFGVAQRGLIKQKGENPHLLTMTATPIPRTVALTMYGDLDLSYLNEMPIGRKIVKTWVVPPEKRDAAYSWIRKQIKETKSQAFIVCPFIEPSESMETVKAVNKEYERLSRDVYKDLRLGLLHGKLKSKEKEDVLQKFKNKKLDILVATPVVEVGIDIPNATIIMIEASERFGLAGLHQLRGRVGRGDKQSYCLLFTNSISALNSHRLKGMEKLHSGAELAELDLKLRGPGNLYGTTQHGVPKLKVASFSDSEMIKKVKAEADQIFSKLSLFPKLEEKINEITLQNVSPD
jgi:ATP-dependent DNA helicase RecG